MNKNFQAGFVQVFVLLILLAGLAGSAYLVQQKTNFLPKAYELKGSLSGPITPTPTPISSISSPITTSCNSCSADINRDGKVDDKDHSVLTACFGKSPSYVLPDGTSCKNADINKDGVINSKDGSCLRLNLAKTCQR